MDEVVTKYDAWTAHDIHLGHDIYTLGNRAEYDGDGLRRIAQIVLDTSSTKPISETRVLDLACLEGMYAIELARRGACAAGIEGREINIEKARFAKTVLSLQNLDLFQDDVRNLGVGKYGTFDVVLCLGILYHLDIPDVFAFIDRMYDVCTDLLVIDTQVALKPLKKVEYKGNIYCGC